MVSRGALVGKCNAILLDFSAGDGKQNSVLRMQDGPTGFGGVIYAIAPGGATGSMEIEDTYFVRNNLNTNSSAAIYTNTAGEVGVLTSTGNNNTFCYEDPSKTFSAVYHASATAQTNFVAASQVNGGTPIACPVELFN